MHIRKVIILTLLFIGCFPETVACKENMNYMEELFNRKSEHYRNFIAKTESWLNWGQKGSVLGCVIGLYGKSQMQKEMSSLDFALSKRLFSGKAIRDCGLGLIIAGLYAQVPYWYSVNNLRQEACIMKKADEEKNEKFLHKK
jgi:hypothetical protein